MMGRKSKKRALQEEQGAALERPKEQKWMMCPSLVPLVRSWLVLSNMFFLGLVFEDIKVFGLVYSLW